MHLSSAHLEWLGQCLTSGRLLLACQCLPTALTIAQHTAWGSTVFALFIQAKALQGGNFNGPEKCRCHIPR